MGSFLAGRVLYGSTAFAWVFVMRHLELATIGVIYSVSMVLLLAGMGILFFEDSLSRTEMALGGGQDAAMLTGGDDGFFAPAAGAGLLQTLERIRGDEAGLDCPIEASGQAAIDGIPHAAIAPGHKATFGLRARMGSGLPHGLEPSGDDGMGQAADG
jgi:hypothetical protein